MVAIKKEKTERKNMKTQLPGKTMTKSRKKRYRREAKKQSCKTVIAPVYNPPDKYINIFTEIELSNWLSSDAVLQSMYEPRLSAFKSTFNKNQYDIIEKLMRLQIKFFRVRSEERVRRLDVECLLCNRSMKFQRAREHCISSQHLRSLLKPFINDESKKYLKESNVLFCSLCNVRLFFEPRLSLTHFQSQTHCENISKLPKSSHISRKNREKNDVVVSEMDASPSLELTESEACEEAVTTEREERLSSDDATFSALNQSNVLTVDEKMLASTINSDNPMVKKQASEEASIPAEVIPEAVSKVPVQNLVPSKLASPKGPVNTMVKKQASEEASIPAEVIPEAASKVPVQNLVPSKLASPKGPVNIFTEITFSRWPSPKVVAQNKLILCNFKREHQEEIKKLCKQLQCQMMFFQVSVGLEKELDVKCSLCNDLLAISAARLHCCSSTHLINIMNHFMDDKNRKYLKKIATNLIYCSLCNFDLFHDPHLYIEHFKSQSHNQKLRTFHSGQKSSKALQQYRDSNKERTNSASLNSASTETRQTDSVKSFVKSGSVVAGIGHANSNESSILVKDLPPVLLMNPPHNLPSSNSLTVSKSISTTSKNINYADKEKQNPRSSPVSLVPLMKAWLLQLPQNTKRRFEALAAELGIQVNFFVVEYTEIVICTLCKQILRDSFDLWQHIESNRHCLNMILPLINIESQRYLNYVHGNFGCRLCNIKLRRGRNLLQHFESSHHISVLQQRSSEAEKLYEQRVLTISQQQPSTSSAEYETFQSTQEKMNILTSPYFISQFLELAFNVKHEINFFSFKASEELTIDCMPCKCSFLSTRKAIDHVQQKKHKQNLERFKKGSKVELWVPSVCDDNWQFLWLVAEKLEVYCTLCCVSLSNKISRWIQHFRSLLHSMNGRNLHSDLMTAELSFPPSGI